MEKLKNFIDEEKGSAIILVLIAIMLISILGMFVLMISSNNLSMASKFRKVSKEYYELDNLCESIAKNIDQELQEAENETISYMEQEKYSKEYELYALNSQANQDFFYRIWKEKVYEPSLTYIIDKDDQRVQVVDTDKYNEHLNLYFQKIFNRVYFNVVSKRLEKNKNDIKAKLKKPDEIKDYELVLDRNKQKDFLQLEYWSDWDDYEPNDKDIILKFNVTNNKNKKISGKININAPKYDALYRKKFNAIKQNSIYEKAINTYGEVKDESNSNDIQKMEKRIFQSRLNKSAILNDKREVLPVNESGIIYLKGNPSNVFAVDKNIEGIVYSEGDLKITGTGIFNGVIIVEGNVEIDKGVTIKHDDKVILNILKNKPKAVAFFKPGAFGDTMYSKEEGDDLNTRARKSIVKQRYKVSEWKYE